MTAIPLVHKDLGVFDLDRRVGAPAPAVARRRYAELFERIEVVDVGGRAQPAALAGIVGELIGGR
jgi:hypothetical protein